MNDLKNKRVMISAGAAGIGLAIARRLTQLGALVEVCDISPESLATAERDVPGLGVFHADVSNENEVKSWFGQAVARMGGLDALINNAGIAGPTLPVSEIDVSDWDRTLQVNLRSQFLCAKFAVPYLKQSNAACIINMSSIAGRLGYPLRTPYAASKWAVIGLTESLALELGEYGIAVNAILPGIVDTERARLVTQAKAKATGVSVHEMQREILSRVALHSMVPVEHIAETVVFLLSDAGRSISGQKLNVCAGVQSLV